MPEIRLGAEANLADVQLGSIQIEEVRIGDNLIWLNNAGPDFDIRGGGTYTYTQNISIVVSGVTDVENPTGPFTYLWEVRDPGGTFQVIPGETGPVLGLSRGPQPTGANAADFIFSNREYRASVSDPSGGVTSKTQTVTVVDAPDQIVVGGWTNSGGPYGYDSEVGGTKFVTDIVNTSCVDEFSTRIIERHNVNRNFHLQNQTRSCTVVQYGLQDSPPKSCSGVTTSRTIEVNDSESTTFDSIQSETQFANPNFVAIATEGVTTIDTNESVTTESGVCTGIDTTIGCGAAMVNCEAGGSTTSTTTTTFYEQPINCLGVPTGPRDIVDTQTEDTLVPCTQEYANPDLLNYFILSSGCGNRIDDNIDCNTTDRSNMAGTVGQNLSVIHTWTHNDGSPIYQDGAEIFEPGPCNVAFSGWGTSQVTGVVTWTANYGDIISALAGSTIFGEPANVVSCSVSVSQYN